MRNKSKKWFIAQTLIDRTNQLLSHSFLGDDTSWDKPNKIGLFDKHSNKMYYWRHPVQAIDRYGWIAERGYCPRYFNKVVELCQPQNKKN